MKLIQTPLLDGIRKNARYAQARKPWGGTTAEVGQDPNMLANMGYMPLGFAAERYTTTPAIKALGKNLAPKALGKLRMGTMMLPWAAVEAGWHDLVTRPRAKNRGAQYGVALAKSNPFVAARAKHRR